MCLSAFEQTPDARSCFTACFTCAIRDSACSSAPAIVGPMSPQLCQHCPRLGIKLVSLSRYAWVNYYRCPNGHVWQVSKDDGHQRDDVTHPPVRITAERLYA